MKPQAQGEWSTPVFSSGSLCCRRSQALEAFWELKCNRPADLHVKLAALPWASYSVSLSLSFQLCKMEPIIPIQIVFLQV